MDHAEVSTEPLISGTQTDLTDCRIVSVTHNKLFILHREAPAACPRQHHKHNSHPLRRRHGRPGPCVTGSDAGWIRGRVHRALSSNNLRGLDWITAVRWRLRGECKRMFVRLGGLLVLLKTKWRKYILKKKKQGEQKSPKFEILVKVMSNWLKTKEGTYSSANIPNILEYLSFHILLTLGLLKYLHCHYFCHFSQIIEVSIILIKKLKI